jgi:microcystin-dependent protein
MSLETFGFISDLVPTNPQGSDPRSQGDDHLRGIKQTLQATFPHANAEINIKPGATNLILGVGTEDALQIDATDKTINALSPYSISGVPPGAVMDFAMNAAPSGWLECNGAPVSRATYAALFAAIGTTWGVGDGSTTFNLPDMRGYFRRGAGTNSDGTASGAFAAKQVDAIISHTHSYQYSNAGGAATTTISRGNVENTGVTIKSSDPSTGVSSETRPYNIAVLTCIKT